MFFFFQYVLSVSGGMVPVKKDSNSKSESESVFLKQPLLEQSVVGDNISHVPISTEHEHVNNQLPVSGVDVMNNAPSNNYAYHSNYPGPPAMNYIPTINYQDSYNQHINM